jgi:hypothetical protein
MSLLLIDDGALSAMLALDDRSGHREGQHGEEVV